jgi:hypothetical protein
MPAAPAKKADPVKENGTAATGWGDTFRNLLPQLIPALIGTVGAVSLVAVVGGAIAWNRFNAAELPADQAVAALPQSALLAVGVGALVGFLLLGAGAVVVVSQVEDRGPYKRRWGLLSLVAGAMTYAILLVPNEVPGVRKGLPVEAKVFLVGMIVVALLLGGVLLGWRGNDPRGAPALQKLVFGAVPLEGAKGLRVLLRRMCWLSPTCPSGGWLRRLLTTKPQTAVARLMMMLFAGEVLFAAVLGVLVDPWLGVTLLIGGVLGAICLLIGDRQRKGFTDYGLAVFVSVVVFGGATEAMKARYDPKVQPAAVIRADDPPGGGLCGIYVTENDKRLYLARIEPDADDKRLPVRDSGRIIFVPHDEVVALAIGPPMPLGNALDRAAALRRELTRDATPARPAAPSPKTVVTTRKRTANGVETIRQQTRTITRPIPTPTPTPAPPDDKPPPCIPPGS